MSKRRTYKHSTKSLSIGLDACYENGSLDLDALLNKLPYPRSLLADSELTGIEFIADYVKEHFVECVDGKAVLRGVIKDERPEYCDNPRSNKLGKGERKFQRDLYFDRIEWPIELKSLQKEDEFIWIELSPNENIGSGIDLISYNPSLRRLSVYELKYGLTKEHVLKAILEIQAYSQRTRFDQFKISWNSHRRNCGKEIKTFDILDFDENNIRKVILIDKRLKYFDEVTYPSIQALLDLFGIEAIYFEGES